MALLNGFPVTCTRIIIIYYFSQPHPACVMVTAIKSSLIKQCTALLLIIMSMCMCMCMCMCMYMYMCMHMQVDVQFAQVLFV